MSFLHAWYLLSYIVKQAFSCLNIFTMFLHLYVCCVGDLFTLHGLKQNISKNMVRCSPPQSHLKRKLQPSDATFCSNESGENRRVMTPCWLACKSVSIGHIAERPAICDSLVGVQFGDIFSLKIWHLEIWESTDTIFKKRFLTVKKSPVYLPSERRTCAPTVYLEGDSVSGIGGQGEWDREGGKTLILRVGCDHPWGL